MDILELAREVILEHSRNPRNFGKPAHYTHHAYCKNPNCGDELTLYLTINPDGQIENITFEGEGCAISKASASLMTEHLKGTNSCDIPEARKKLDSLITPTSCNIGTPEPEITLDTFQEMDALRGVRSYPARVPCAQLAWQALDTALVK